MFAAAPCAASGSAEDRSNGNYTRRDRFEHPTLCPTVGGAV